MNVNSTQAATLPQATTGDTTYGVDRSQTSTASAVKSVTTATTDRATAAQKQAQAQEAAKQLNDFMKQFSTKLNFSVDSDTKQIVVKVINQESGEVIRQIPTEEALKLAKATDTLQGLIIRAQV